ncbi:MAG TPA: error-prone DNA polymerase [Ilumatobacter sp.]|nr:error-prone DNA polymerase [Ilumatobacter sp.]
MGFNNPAWTWKELERALSDGVLGRDGRPPASPSWNSGGDGPAWSRKRQPFEPTRRRTRGEVPYAELHCHSNYSFLDGASHPEELVEEAVELGLEALALTDHNGFYGVVRFAEAADRYGLPVAYGAEITLTPGLAPDARVARLEDDTQDHIDTGELPDAHVPDPHGDHLLVLADGPTGYARLSRALSLGHLAGEKGAPQFTLADIADQVAGHAWVLTGCRKGSVPRALVAEGPAGARRELERMVSAFGRDRVLVELWDHGDPLDSHRNDALAELAQRVGVGCVATNNVHYAKPAQRRLATAIAAVRSRRSLDEIDAWLPAAASAHLRSGVEQARRFARYPGAVALAAEVGMSAAFKLELIGPKLPPFTCPDGLSEMAYLRRLAEQGAAGRYGPRGGTPVGGHVTADVHARAWATLDRELAIIEQLNYPGYFLVVWDLVRYCRDVLKVLCQGRGSAANSVVCYVLGITNVDAVYHGLLFERFLSAVRDEPPDIDIDIESDEREHVIQYVYTKHGRHHTAQVANVITYRPRSALRDMAKAFGYQPGQQDAFAKQVDGWGNLDTVDGIPGEVLEMARQIADAPRHLGIHSGGMVICDRPVIEVCPVEWGRMDKRSVLQWDKDDCHQIKLIKFDLLGLGMLSALRYAFEYIAEHRGRQLDLASIPPDDHDVYDMLCRADTVGVFQVESRAQMATLPRLRPREFYDLVIEVALIRPGPIQGGSVHPYIRRRHGEEPVTYLHPKLKACLERTKGVPLFQEQLMQMAIDIAGFTPAESDELRQAMGSKRSADRMDELRERLFVGMAANGITGDDAEQIFTKMKAFASYGFPESHAMSFAHLVYASSWIKYHEPAAFCAALIKAQPMGFWSPHTLVQDAQRHGVTVRTPDLNASGAAPTLEDGGDSVRLGLASVRGVGKELAGRIEAARVADGPYTSPEDLVRRVPELTQTQLESLAMAGVFGCFGLDRRGALWAAGAVAQSRPGRLPGAVVGESAPHLPGLEPVEESAADLWSTGVSPDGHPTKFVRAELDRMNVVKACDLATIQRRWVRVAGVVTHRQRPMTAQGTTFLSLEDETGLINVIVSKHCWDEYATVARTAHALVVVGRLERAEGVVNIVANHLVPLPLATTTLKSRDFR